jgi:hypothetical protein
MLHAKDLGFAALPTVQEKGGARRTGLRGRKGSPTGKRRR